METPICNKWHVGTVEHGLGHCWHRTNNLQIYVTHPMMAKSMFNRANAPLCIWRFQSQKCSSAVIKEKDDDDIDIYNDIIDDDDLLFTINIISVKWRNIDDFFCIYLKLCS